MIENRRDNSAGGIMDFARPCDTGLTTSFGSVASWALREKKKVSLFEFRNVLFNKSSRKVCQRYCYLIYTRVYNISFMHKQNGVFFAYGELDS